jgi:hypothetical protein
METPVLKRGSVSPDLKPDPAIVQGSIDRSDAVPLAGFLDTGSTEQSVRLYESVARNRWFEILRSVIVDRARSPEGDGRSVVWVRRDATLDSCESVRASDYEGPADPKTPFKWPRP